MNFAQLLFWCIAAASLWCRHVVAAPFDAEVRDMTYLGYDAHATPPRVFVRTNEPVRYRVEQGRHNVVTLVLANTGVVRRLNTYSLATQFLPGPVQRVRATVVEKPSASVRVDITLREAARYRVEQHDTELALVF